jgi:mono/diheme cytochrome c family protein
MSHSTERFLDWTLYGKSSDMPAFDEVLEDQEIADIYAYMETLVEE